MKEIEEMKKPRGIFTVPFVQELTKEESKGCKEEDVDLEALQVELEYVDNNLNQQVKWYQRLKLDILLWCPNEILRFIKSEKT